MWNGETNGWKRTQYRIVKDKYREDVVCGVVTDTRVPKDACQQEEYRSPEYGDWSCWSVGEDGKWTLKRQVIVKDAHYNNECPEKRDPDEEVFEVKDSETITLTKAAEYRAIQFPGGEEGLSWLVLIAVNPDTTSCKVFLEPLAEDAANQTEYALRHIVPDEPGNEVITPFVVFACFEVSDGFRSVFVHDANGKHQVSVEQLEE